MRKPLSIWPACAALLLACNSEGARSLPQGSAGTSAAASGRAAPVPSPAAPSAGMGASLAAASGGGSTGSSGSGAGAAAASAAGSPAVGMAGAGAAGSAAAAGGASTAGAGAAGGVAAAGASFTRVWSEIFVAKGCTVTPCHGAGQGALTLSSKAQAHKALVNVAAAGAACMAGGMLRVKPGEPSASLLFDKLAHTAPSCGELMPIGAKLAPNCSSPTATVCTTEAELALVKDWITAGALDN
jgi:hypothetical protein